MPAGSKKATFNFAFDTVNSHASLAMTWIVMTDSVSVMELTLVVDLVELNPGE